MIAKKYRITKEEIAPILKSGYSLISKLFIIRFKENSKTFFRYRVIISKKISTKAVKRNQLRRQVYEALRINNPEEGKKQNFDLILIPKKRILTTNFQPISEDIIQNIIKKIHGKNE